MIASYLIVCKHHEVAFEVKVSIFSICFFTNYIKEFLIPEVYLQVVANKPFCIFVVKPIKFVIRVRDDSSFFMLEDIRVVHVFILEFNDFGEELTCPPPIG